MGKTKGGTLLNPADAQRKAERKKEVNRNKLERKFIRDAASQRDKPEDIKKQLQEIIDVEESGKLLTKQLRLKKKVLQEAYEVAARKAVDEKRNAARVADGSGVSGSAAAPARPEDSRYYHPTLNPTGAPPPGKAPATALAAPAPGQAAAAAAPVKLAIPVPRAPPLPAGPAPSRAPLPPPPSAPPLPPGPAPTGYGASVLPPPPGPPPGVVLPPPPGLPSLPGGGAGSVLPPPAGPPPGALPPPPGPPPGVLPPPAGPPSGVLPPPAGPPPGVLPPPSGPPPGILPPPGMPPPGVLPPPQMPPPFGAIARAPGGPPGGVLPPPLALPPAAAAATTAAAATRAPGERTEAMVSGASTVVKRPLAQHDKALTAMVPASVRIRREQAAEEAVRKKARMHQGAAVTAASGFGLAPVSRPAQLTPLPSAAVAPRAKAPMAPLAGPPASTDSKYLEFMATMGELGAFE
ncbi:hypothetical protein FOA52_003390 [Chlamydomonas sp. UWO 241]|nr:hypothetical protein FOA52_003390 [Chlamydomonas sp. UWO 241]